MNIEDNSLVSIVILVYNAEKYLGKCVKSVIKVSDDFRLLEGVEVYKK